MKAFNLVFAICFGFLFSCNSKQEFNATEKSIEKDSLVSLKRTVIANLPDSLQPKTVLLIDMPKPVVREVPEGGGETIMLPVLEDENGKPILDQDGNTILMGDGGISNFTNFTTDNGLALDAVICSLLDKFGNLWFGTFGGGVSRYDGKSFSTFTTAQGLANNIVWNITEDKTGNLWFGTFEGVSRYDGESFRTFTTAQGLANNIVQSITEDKTGYLWFGTQNGVSRYDGKSFRTFTTDDGLAHNFVFSITEDSTGNLWFGTNGGGVSRYDGQSFSIFTTAQGLAHNVVRSITKDNTGNLWFGTGGGGVSRYDGQSFRTFTTTQGLIHNFVWSITEDKAGNLWFGTEDGGVSRYDGKSFSTFTTAQGLAHNFVRSITRDKTGNLWFGTFGGGVSRYNGESFTTFSTAQGLAHNVVRSITEDNKGNLWFGTDGGGVSRYDGESFSTFITTQGLAHNIVYSITEDNRGNLWFGTADGGVSRYDGESLSTFTTAQGLAHNFVRFITEDNMGNLWFGTASGGVSRYDGKSFSTFTTTQGVASNFVSSITEDNTGNLWFSTLGGGVSRYDGKSFSTFTIAHGLANNFIRCITRDNTGNLWFGTTEGLSVIRAGDVRILAENSVLSGVEGEGDRKKIDIISSNLFKSFRIADGLPDNVVMQVIQMPDGKMAVGTNLGITLFNPSHDFTKLTDIEIYNTNTGYPVKNVNLGQNALILDSKGIIWVGTGSEKTALVRFDPASLKTNMEAPTLVIQSIKVNEENIPWYDLNEKPVALDSITTPAYVTEEVGLFGRELTETERDSLQKRFEGIQFDGIRPFYPVPEKLVLPHEHNHISFEFAAIETSRPFMIKYQYMLEGYDKDWSPLTSRSNATFGNIHEGNYTFRLKAQGPNGVWTEPVTYSFTVLPPWYRSWWAYVIYSLFLVVIVWRIHTFQKARTIRIEREKTKDKELAQAKEIEQAYNELGKSHEKLKSTQAQLIQSEKMASLGQLTAGIAHEIQNPLNFVNNFSEVSNDLIVEIEEERNKNLETRDEKLIGEILADVKDNLGKITLHGKRADSIVKGMLEHSRASSGEKVLTDINALANEYLKLSYHGMRAKDKNFQADFKTDFDPHLPKINVVPQEIGRVFLNIFNNAFQACMEQGKREKGLENGIQNDPNLPISYFPLVKISTKNLGDKIEISISDNGSGIPDSIKDKIFQPFFTTKPTGEGTGLGLSLSYDIIKAHGGELKLDNKEGEGSEFKIVLPV